jgi:hypothetical protein
LSALPNGTQPGRRAPVAASIGAAGAPNGGSVLGHVTANPVLVRRYDRCDSNVDRTEALHDLYRAFGTGYDRRFGKFNHHRRGRDVM